MSESPKNGSRIKNLLILLGVLLENAVIIGILIQGFFSTD